MVLFRSTFIYINTKEKIKIVNNIFAIVRIYVIYLFNKLIFY